MAIAQYGVLGPQNGKIRNFAFYMLKGRPVCRTIGRYIDKPSPDQKINRNGMTAVMPLVQALRQIINLGFGIEARGTVCSPFNLAVSYNKKHALKGQGEDVKVNYEKVLISKGVLPGAAQAAVKKVDGGILVTWESNEKGGAYGGDMLMVALCYPGLKSSDNQLNKANRQAGELFIPISKSREKEPVEIYMFFRTIDGERVSDSQYLGNMNGKAMTKEEQEQYDLAMVAFAKAQTSFAKQQQKFEDTGKKTRGYRDLEKECLVWKSRLFDLSGRPV